MFRVVALFAAVLMSVAAPTMAFDIDSLLTLSIGGPAAKDSVLALESIFYRGTAVMGGMEGQLTAWVMLPDKYLLQFKSEALNITRGCSGNSVWERDQNGRVFDLSGFDRDMLRKAAYFESFAHIDPRRSTGTREYMGVHQLGPTMYHVIQFVPAGGDTTWMYLDSFTDLCDVIETRVDHLLVTTTLADYRTVNGILIPFFVRDTVDGMTGSSTTILEQADVNLTIDPVIFEKPRTVEVDFRFPSDASSVTIPFSFVESHIFVQATLNGKLKVYLLLDSGASANIYYKPTVENLDLPIIGYMPVQGVAADDSVGLVRVDSVQVGDLALYRQVAGMMDESPIGFVTMENAKFGGVLGFDFLSRFPVMIDYERYQLTVFNPEKFALPPGGTIVPFELHSKIPTTRATVAGADGNFIIDLGNAIGMVLHDEFVVSNNLEMQLEGIHDLEGGMLGVGGMAHMRGAKVQSLKIGNLDLGATKVFLPEAAGGMSASRRIDGNIGNPILKRFTVLLDYERNRLVLYPPDSANRVPN